MAERTRGIIPGAILGGRYEVLEVLGSGSFSTVFRVRDQDLQADYAFKVLRDLEVGGDPDMLQRLKREVLLSQKVAHEGCCRIFDFLSLDGLAVLKMELVDGITLAGLLRRSRLLPLPLALRLAAQTAAACAALHRQGIVHRDIKASNVMVTRGGRVKIMDLGVSWSADMASLTLTGTLLGTPSYMAPELILQQEANPRTDVYSLGVLYYLLFCGRLPFTALALAQLFMMQVHTDPVPLRELRPEIPGDIDELVLACLQKDPSSRPADASALDLEWRRLGLEPDPAAVSEAMGALPLPPEPSADSGSEATSGRGGIGSATVRTPPRWPVMDGTIIRGRRE